MNARERQFFSDQVMRLSGLQNFPFHAQGATELVNVLMSGAKDEKHARLVIDAVLEADGECPTPKELKNFCRQAVVEKTTLSAGCVTCHGQPWVTIDLPNGVGVRRCTCPRGQQLAEADRVRKESGVTA